MEKCTYIITYLKEGTSYSVTQEKNLISHEDYISFVVPGLKRIDELEVNDQEEEAKKIKREIKDKFGEHYFTDKSPLFYGIENGFIDIEYNNGGKYFIFAEKKEIIEDCEQMIKKLHPLNVKKTSLIAIAKIASVKNRKKINLRAIIFNNRLNKLIEEKMNKAREIKNQIENQLPF